MISKTKKMLADGIQNNRKALWDWQIAQATAAPPPFYCSIDLRDAGFKIVPVDSNLFPAGFNNICPEDVRAAPRHFKARIEAIAAQRGIGTVARVLVIPESHTSNLFYIENLYHLTQLLAEAGYEMRVGWLGSEGVKLVSESGKELQAHPISLDGGKLSAEGFVPDLVVLNNDFSGGYPPILDQVSQPIVPSHRLGWHSRKKTEHFRHYNDLAGEFAAIIGVDPWLVRIDTEEVGPVNFNDDLGTEEVAQAVGRVLERTRAAYETHKINRKPFVYVKNNAGTYGMGIMVVRSVEELHTMNRRTKNKMSVGKNRAHIESVAVQEGVPTATLVDRLPAEPVIYLCGDELIGGFLRTNQEKSDEENLNSQGMVFRKLCMSDLKSAIEDTEEGDLDKPEPLLELVYGSIARLSALATGRELKAHLL